MSIQSELEFKARDKKERRRLKKLPPPMYLIFGRRKEVRRALDSNGRYFTDHRRPGLSALIIFISVMSILDYGFTLIHLKKGAIELNPLMAMAIEVSESYFFLLKYLLTSFGLFILYLYKDFFPIEKVVFSIFIIYCTLIIYHIVGYYSMSS
ncbi:MAG: hypothetical protein GY799_18085 [Desulfobulbaceae bacterium]|nr:hypothetical protein [Desulfobulbaceae bacterium]